MMIFLAIEFSSLGFHYIPEPKVRKCFFCSVLCF